MLGVAHRSVQGFVQRWPPRSPECREGLQATFDVCISSLDPLGDKRKRETGAEKQFAKLPQKQSLGEH